MLKVKECKYRWTLSGILCFVVQFEIVDSGETDRGCSENLSIA